MEKHQTKQYKCEKCGEPLDKRGEEIIEYSKRTVLHFIECKKCGHMTLVRKEKI
jgi:DNA-directed RNA polymerase subunit RPC12/RpoP